MTTSTQGSIDRANLLAVFQEVAAGFASARDDIDQRVSTFKSALQTLKTHLARAAGSARQSSIRRDHSLAKMLDEYISLLDSQLQDWQRGVAEWDRRTEFRGEFGDSLLVFVYGKVKAGKSSLGNYVAWGVSEPAGPLQGDPAPVFKVHDDSGVSGDAEDRIEKARHFKVGATETTSRIQTFRLPGLTWVDSPGIHSMHDARNGALARQYANSADLIIYTMSSDAPGRRSDMEEVLSLLSQRKPLVVVLTRSDRLEEDETDDGRIVKVRKMKPAADRTAQQAKVREEMSGLSAEQRNMLLSQEIYSISVKFAEESRQDPTALRESGIGPLFARLAEIARGESVRLKQTTPLNNLRTFGDRLQQSQRLLRKDLEQIKEIIAEQQRKLETTAGQLKAEIVRDMRTHIERALLEHRGNSDALKRELDQRLQAVASAVIDRGLRSLLDSVDMDLADVVNKAPIPDLPGFQERYAEIHLTTRWRWRGMGGLLGSGIGAVVGGLIAGPIGATIGATLAGGMGGAIGGRLGANSGQAYRVPIGDNIDEIEQSAHTAYQQAAEGIIEQAYLEPSREMLLTLESFIAESLRAVDEFSNKMAEVVE